MSGTYQGLASANSTPNNIVLRDSNSNFATNSVVQNINSTTSAASTTILTAASAPIQVLTGTQTQIFTLPDANTLITNQQYQFI